MQCYYVCSRLLLLEQLKDRWIDSLQELSTLGTSLKRPLSKGIIHHPKPLNNLKTSTTSSRKVMNCYTKLGNGRDIKKLKENVYAIQVGCQICEGPHLDKECPLNEEVNRWKRSSKVNLVKKTLLKSLVIDCFEEALDPDKDPMERSFDDYKWVFDLEIEQLADEYELEIGKKGHILD
nr:hypothetical protein [Tanacetum cinerariifolium]